MNSRPEHIRPLTSLRFIAAMMIFLVHTSDRLGMPNFKSIFAFGHGVSFFYVLSGFILTYVYIGSGKSFNLKEFIRSRLARLYPLHIATFLAAILLVPNVQDTLAQRVWQIPLQLTMTQSWLGTYKAALGFNGPAWSISTEFGFYLIFPFFLKFYRVIYKIFFAAIVLTGLVIISAMYSEGALASWLWQALHVHPLGRLVEFIAGICAAKAFLSGSSSWSRRVFTISEVLIVFFIILFGSLNQEIYNLARSFDNGLNLSAYFNRSGLFVFFGFLIWIFAHAKGAVSQFLSNSVLVLLGKISFAFYLIHQIVISFFEQNYELLLGYGPIVTFIFLLSLSIGFSYVAYKLIEVPFQKAIRKSISIESHNSLPTPKVKTVLGVAGLVLFVGCVFPIFSPGYKGPSNQDVIRFQSNAIEANFNAVNSDIVLTHYRYKKFEDEICYEMLWEFGEMELDTPLRRILNVPFQDRRKTIRNEIIVPSSAWASSTKEKIYALDEFCFATLHVNPDKTGRRLARIMIRQKTDDGFKSVKFDVGHGAQNMLLLDYNDPGSIIWLKKKTNPI